MTLLKAPLLICAALFNTVIWTPPNPTAPAATQVKVTGVEAVMRKVIRSASFLAMTSLNIAYIIEAALILALAQSSFPLSGTILQILASGNPATTQEISLLSQQLRITPSFAIGLALLSFGGLVRLSCYRALGRFYTFELSLIKEHRLVTTGPYSYVRHPGYTAGTVGIGGMILSGFSPGSWILESGFAKTLPGGCIIWLWLSFALGLWAHTFGRAKTEDEYLRNHFGAVWLEWADRARWRMYPGLF